MVFGEEKRLILKNKPDSNPQNLIFYKSVGS